MEEAEVRTPCPIITAQGRLLDLERVHQSDDVDGEHRLLAVSEGFA